MCRDLSFQTIQPPQHHRFDYREMSIGRWQPSSRSDMYFGTHGGTGQCSLRNKSNFGLRRLECQYNGEIGRLQADRRRGQYSELKPLEAKRDSLKTEIAGLEQRQRTIKDQGAIARRDEWIETTNALRAKRAELKEVEGEIQTAKNDLGEIDKRLEFTKDLLGDVRAELNDRRRHRLGHHDSQDGRRWWQHALGRGQSGWGELFVAMFRR